MNGFIKIHKKIMEWEWYDEPNTFRVFIHLLFKANFKDHKWRGMTIKRGQVPISLRQLSEDLGISIQNVRTSLNHLKSTHEITIKSTNRVSVITIENYEKYQLNEEELTHKPTHEVTINQQATNTPTQKKDNNYIYYPPISTNVDISPQNEKPPPTKNGKRGKGFSPPTVEDVKAYCMERKNSVDAERFVDYYSSQKWKKANGLPVSDWKACVRTWEENGYGNRDRDDKSKQRVAESDEGRVSVYSVIGNL